MKVSLLSEKPQFNSSFNNTKYNTTGIVFIDPKIDDYEMLMVGVTPGLEVVLCKTLLMSVWSGILILFRVT